MIARHVTDASPGPETGIVTMLERTLATLDDLPDSAGKRALTLEAHTYEEVLARGGWVRPRAGEPDLLLQNVRELYAATIAALARARAEKVDAVPRRRPRHLAPAD